MKKISFVIQIIILVSGFNICCGQSDQMDSLLQLLKTTRDDTNKVKVLHRLSRICPAEETMNYAKSGLALAEKLNYRTGIAKAQDHIGLRYLVQGDITNAWEYLNKSLAIRLELNDPYSIAQSYMNIGQAYSFQGNYSMALEYWHMSLKIQEEIRDKEGVEISLNNIAAVYVSQGDFIQALEYFQKCLAIAREIADKNQVGTFLNNLGYVYQKKGDLDSAMVYFQHSLKAYQEINFDYGIGNALHNIAWNYDKSGNFSLALEYYNKSLEVKRKIKDKKGIADSYKNMGDLYRKQGSLPLAEKFCKRAYQTAKETGNVEMLRETSHRLSEISALAGDFKTAYEMQILFKLMADSISNENSRKSVIKKQMQYEFEKREAIAKAEHEKREALSSAEIGRQKLIRNATFGGGGLAGIFSFMLISSYIRRKKTSFEKQVSEIEMKALRSQMNPHFIFNSLQSVKKYILDNAINDGAEYLSKFASLMRMILENSRKQEVPLEKDLSALELYMQLESLRFQKKFQFEIEVDPQINREDTLIPPLILQPFVENSIIHGISSRENGMIKIKVMKEDNMIRCTVEDNGIGRDQSVRIESGEKKKRESLGMKITQERLSIINQLKKVKTAVNIFDLKDEENRPGGLRVELLLPFETAF